MAAGGQEEDVALVYASIQGEQGFEEVGGMGRTTGEALRFATRRRRASV